MIFSWCVYIHAHCAKETVESLFRNKRDFTPEKSNHEYLEQFITNISNELLSPTEKE